MSEFAILLYPTTFDTQLGGPRRNIAIRFGAEKLVWRGYPILQKFEDMLTRFDTIYEHKTNRQTPHGGLGRAMHSVMWQKE